MSLFYLADQATRCDEDLQLLLRIRNRDQAAVSELYDRYSALLYTIIVRIVKTTVEAEDVLQEVFLQIWNKAALFEQERGGAYTWIVTIARRKAIDRLRAKELVNKGESLDDDSRLFMLPDVAHTSNPFFITISNEYEELVRAGLARLSTDQQTILEMSYFEGHTQAQIAVKLGIPLGTVKTRMRTGLMKLRDYLEMRMK